MRAASRRGWGWGSMHHQLAHRERNFTGGVWSRGSPHEGFERGADGGAASIGPLAHGEGGGGPFRFEVGGYGLGEGVIGEHGRFLWGLGKN